MQEEEKEEEIDMTFASRIKSGIGKAVDTAKANYKKQQAKQAHEKEIYQTAYAKAREEGIKTKARRKAKMELGLIKAKPAAKVVRVKSITPKQTDAAAKRMNPFGRF